MGITQEELEQLRKYRNTSDKDDVRYKQIIKRKVLKNNKLIYLIHNKELEDEEASADEYYGVNILPYYLIAPVQHNVQNYICFEVSQEEVSRGNSVMKVLQVILYVLCHHKDINVKELNSARHDVIAAELINDFQGCNDFGTQLKLISDKPSVVDNDYAARTLIFEQITTNSLTNNGRTTNLRAGY